MDNIWQFEELEKNLVIHVHDGIFALRMAGRMSLLSIWQRNLLEIRV